LVRVVILPSSWVSADANSPTLVFKASKPVVSFSIANLLASAVAFAASATPRAAAALSSAVFASSIPF
jgi:hypothetical protein